jgi:CheY-like chemotaxis protein
LCEELAQKTQDEIIDLSIQKIQNEDIDLVLLDFRLHPNDFNSSKIDNVTGLMLLQEIKKYNPGIQVIIFSATNKVWNLQKLLEAGADDFILKESIETNPYQSKESIINFVESCKICFERAFLKDFYFLSSLMSGASLQLWLHSQGSNAIERSFGVQYDHFRAGSSFINSFNLSH